MGGRLAGPVEAAAAGVLVKRLVQGAVVAVLLTSSAWFRTEHSPYVCPWRGSGQGPQADGTAVGEAGQHQGHAVLVCCEAWGGILVSKRRWQVCSACCGGAVQSMSGCPLVEG